MPGRRPRFSEMLVDRRRRLGLSISQASQVLRLKEQVLVAFEEGDFDHIPKSGYAQGMLASYARYLGLDSRQVSEQFAADLGEYLRQVEGRDRSGARGGRTARSGGTHAYGDPSAARYSGARGLLPTSGGLAGDLGAFATTSQPRRHQRSGDEGSIERVDDLDQARTGYQATRRYTTRNPGGGTRARAPRGSERSRTRPARDLGAADARQGYPGRDRVTARRVRSGDYVDDLRYDDGARPFEAASTTTGRRSSRNIASTRRPNVQRRSSQGRRPSRQPPRRGGLAGVVDDFFADPRRALLVIVIIAALLLTVMMVSSVRSCIANQNATGRTVEVTQGSAGGSGERRDEDTSAADAQALADAAAAKKPEEPPTETVVEVSVADGMVSWVEILCDGSSEEADTITGPWERSYTVADSITVKVGDTSSVTVTENGEQRRFDTQKAGIGSITIQSAAKAAADAEAGEDGGASPTDDGAGGGEATSDGAGGSY